MADTSIRTATTSDGIAVTLVREPGSGTAGVVAVSLPREIARSGNGFSFPLPEVIASSGALARVSAGAGAPLPAWLRYQTAARLFVGTSVPDGALPVKLEVEASGQTTTIVIYERAS